MQRLGIYKKTASKKKKSSSTSIYVCEIIHHIERLFSKSLKIRVSLKLGFFIQPLRTRPPKLLSGSVYPPREIKSKTSKVPIIVLQRKTTCFPKDTTCFLRESNIMSMKGILPIGKVNIISFHT